MYYSIRYNSDAYLAHHGIKGQKWGVRRFQNSDGSLTKAGKERYGSSSDSHDKGDDKVKNYLIQSGILALGVGTATAGFFVGSPQMMAVGAMLAVESNINISAMLAGDIYTSIHKKKLENESANDEIDEKTGLKLKSKEYTPKEDLKRINPEYHNSSSNTKSNCMLCTTAYDMRRRGFDVQANKATEGYEYEDIKRWYPKAELKIVNEGNCRKTAAKLAETLIAQGEGARGNIMIMWDYDKTQSYGGHSMIYEIENGKAMLKDGQTGKTYGEITGGIAAVGGNYPLYYAEPSVTYARLDNVDFDPKGIKEAVR